MMNTQAEIRERTREFVRHIREGLRAHYAKSFATLLFFFCFVKILFYWEIIRSEM